MTAIWLFLKGVPLWVWAVIALVIGGWLYGNSRYHAGEDARQAQWDAQKAKDQAEVDRQNRQNRAKEAADELAAAESRKTYEYAISAGEQRAAALAADLLSERRKLRDLWAPGRCDAGSDSAADRSGEENARLRASAVERIVATGAEADARITFLLARYAQAEKVCGTIPER